MTYLGGPLEERDRKFLVGFCRPACIIALVESDILTLHGSSFTQGFGQGCVCIRVFRHIELSWAEVWRI